MKIIVGLGNPGKQYELTRHNVGFMAIDAIADEYGLTWAKWKDKYSALVARYNDIILVKPQDFMNVSGLAVRNIFDYYKIPVKEDLANILTVIHDDLDVDLGTFKVATSSRAAGHNGVQSLIDHLGTKKFTRCRVGIRVPTPRKIPSEKFVLEKFKKEELAVIKQQFPEIKKIALG